MKVESILRRVRTSKSRPQIEGNHTRIVILLQIIGCVGKGHTVIAILILCGKGSFKHGASGVIDGIRSYSLQPEISWWHSSQIMVILGEATIRIHVAMRQELMLMAIQDINPAIILVIELELTKCSTALQSVPPSKHHAHSRIARLHLRGTSMTASMLLECSCTACLLLGYVYCGRYLMLSLRGL